jgi:hypothetical protein
MAFDLSFTGATYNAAGRYGQSLNGGSGEISGVLPSATQFTIEASVKLASTSTIQVAVGQAAAAWLGVSAAGVPTVHYGLDSGTEQVINGSAAITDGAWHTLRLDVTPSGGTFYVDGVVVGTGAKNGATSSVNVATNPFGVRKFGGSGSFGWQGEIDEVAIYSAPPTTQGANYTPAIISNSASGLVALYHLDGNGTNSAGVAAPAPAPAPTPAPAPAPAPASVAIAVDSAAITWSPCNWDTLAPSDFGVSVKTKQTACCGAYLKTQVTGTTNISLGIDTSTLAGFGSNAPLVMWSVGGGPLQQAQLTIGASTLALGTGLTAGSTYTVQVWLLGSVESQGTRFGASGVSPTNVLRVTGIVLDSGGSASAHPMILGKRAVFFSDSFGEGVRAAGTTVQPADHGRSAPWFALPALGCEYGIVGFGAQGWASPGNGSVPNLPSAWTLHTTGRARSIAGVDYVFVMEGFNGSTTSAVVQAWISNVRAVNATAWIFVVNHPGGVGAAAQTAGVNAYKAAVPADTKVASIDYSDIIATADFSGPINTGTPTAGSVDKCHPRESANAAIGSAIVAKVQAAMGGGGTVTQLQLVAAGAL